MTKINFNNEKQGDDELLIDLLKKVDIREPSSRFTEETMNKFLDQKVRASHSHRPLKFPLILMAILGLFLISPIIISILSGISLPSPGDEIRNILGSITFEVYSRYLFYPFILCITLILILQIEMRINKGKFVQ